MQPYRFEYGRALEKEKNEIRLLSLKSGDEHLEGTLLIRRLELDQIPVDEETNGVFKKTVTQPKGEAPATESYEALSYPWGEDQTETEQIWLKVGEDDDEACKADLSSPTKVKDAAKQKSKPFPITKNLKSALVLLRSQIKPPDIKRYIWVDAICINQNNKSEKGIQIPLMAEIYSHAKNVCVWLGEDDTNDSSKAISFMRRIAQLNDFDNLVADDEMVDEWDAVRSLLKRRWFSRRWIVQEIAVAREAVMYCGSGVIRWDEFADAVSLFSSRSDELRGVFKRATGKHNHPDYLGDIEKLGASWLSNKLDTLFRKANNGRGRVLEHLLSLEALMSSLTLFEAGDPRDTLYAILWLANDVRQKSLTHYLEDHSSAPSEDNSPDRDESVGIGPITVNGAGQPHANNSVENQKQSINKEPETDGSINHAKVVAKDGGHPRRAAAVHESNHDRSCLPPEHVSSKESQAAASSSTEFTAIPRSPGSPRVAFPPVPALKAPSGTAYDATYARRHSTSGEVQPAYSGSIATRLGVSELSARRSHSRGKSLSIRTERRPSFAQSVQEDPASADNHISYKGPELMIDIDYGKSVYAVCKDFMYHAFSRFGYIDMMCRPWAPEPDDTCDPPWLPPSWMMTLRDNVSFELDAERVYRRTKADPLVGFPGLKVKRNYNASGASRAFDPVLNARKDGYEYPPKFEDNQSLRLKGFKVAKVWRIGDPATHGHIPGKWLDLVPQVAPFTVWNHKSERERPPPTFWRTLVGDRGEDGISHPPRHFEMACKWAFQKATRAQGLSTTELLTHGSCPSHVSAFLKRVQCVVWQRRLIIAVQDEKSDRLLCLAPEDVEAGDMICILRGCSVPVVLREQNGTSTKSPPEKWYKFIGECYVHDMMNGEVFRQRKQFYPDDKNMNEMDFEVR